jgi:O-acetyl-ADP-ribose deacetylase (regulator of RNase III)
MGEPKTGEAFITHEYDEAIAVQQCIVDAETKLSTKHPVTSTKTAIKAALSEDKAFLRQLKSLGKPHGATGKIEDVAEGLTSLMKETLETATAGGADSDYYEAHAVLLNIKRKQMDSAGGMLEIARATKDAELRTASTAFAKAQKASCQVLADELAGYAAKIATAA